MSGSQSTSSSKLKAASREERLQKWKECFKNLCFINSPEITDASIKIVNCKLNDKLKQFTMEELHVVLNKKKKEKLQVSTKYLQEFGRQQNFTTYLFYYAMQSMNKTRKTNGRNVVSLRNMITESIRNTETKFLRL